MAVIATKNKFIVLPGFTSVPKTSKIEADHAALTGEHRELEEFRQSKDLEEFLSLEKHIQSKEFVDQVTEIAQKIKSENEKAGRYNALKKSKNFSSFFAFKDSAKLQQFNDFRNSGEYQSYLELEQLIGSKEFLDRKRDAEAELSRLKQKENDRRTLEKTGNIRFFNKFSGSEPLSRFTRIVESEEFSRFHALEKEVTTPAFKQKQNTTPKKEFETTDEGKKWAEYQQLLASSDIRFYQKFSNSSKYRRFLDIKKSIDYKKYNTLIEETSSDEFVQALGKKQQEVAEMEDKNNTYHKLKKSKQFRDHFRFEESKPYREYVAFGKSKELADYIQLEAYVLSEDFRNKMSELQQQEQALGEKKQQYESFKNSKKYQWYLQLKDSDKFNNIKRWELTFEDDFDGTALNSDKWLTRYYWGEQLIGDAYALVADTAFPTDGKNISVSGSVLSIEMRRERNTGKVWQQPFGFVPKEFEYTTGLINTGKSFRQKYGKFEAKIRVRFSKPVQYNFWMSSDKILPHVNIMKLSKSAAIIEMANHWGDPLATSRPDGRQAEKKWIKASHDFFIYTFEWSKDKLVWKINGIVVNEQTTGVPQEEMYLVFNLNMFESKSIAHLPVNMEIDWVRCYRQV